MAYRNTQRCQSRILAIDSPEMVWLRPGERIRWQKQLLGDVRLDYGARCLGMQLFGHCLGKPEWMITIPALGVEIGMGISYSYECYAKLCEYGYTRRSRKVLAIIPPGCRNSAMAEPEFRYSGKTGEPSIYSREEQQKTVIAAAVEAEPEMAVVAAEAAVEVLPEPQPPIEPELAENPPEATKAEILANEIVDALEQRNYTPIRRIVQSVAKYRNRAQVQWAMQQFDESRLRKRAEVALFIWLLKNAPVLRASQSAKKHGDISEHTYPVCACGNPIVIAGAPVCFDCEQRGKPSP